MKTSTSLSIFALFAGFTLTQADDCHANNCLRAIRNTKRPGSADCSSYLRTTTTPATVSITYYSPVSVVAQETLSVTLTDTFYDTSTTTTSVTLTESPTVTSTSTVWTTPAETIKKRQEASPIPAYASPCPNASAYVSACSCIGVTGPIIVTAPTPTITVTVPSTTTYSTATETTTVETTSITITDATITQTTTDFTTTLPTVTVTVTQTLAVPNKCKVPVTLYNGLRPVDLSKNFATFPQGPGFDSHTCCLRCHEIADCAAFVMNYNGPTTCLVLKVIPAPAGQNPDATCPNGYVPMIYGSPPGSVGKGRCESS